MRKLAVLFVAILCFSCSNELDVIEPSGDIPIIYGFLDASEDVQYIRVEKAFVDPITSALELAQRPDSLYYPETATVSITNDIDDNEVFLTRIDGNDEGLVREEGVFAQSPNYLYKVETTDLNMDFDASYTVNLERGDNLQTVSATTNLVGESRFISPNPASTDPVLSFTEGESANITFRTDSKASIYDVFVDINYVERLPGESFEAKQITWELARGLTRRDADDSSIRYMQSGDEFFVTMAAAIPVVTDIQRRFRTFDLRVVGANQELEEYLRVGQANLGITSTQDVPVYDNLTEGRGIFASKYESTFEGIGISNASLDDLVNGSITADLNFDQ